MSEIDETDTSNRHVPDTSGWLTRATTAKTLGVSAARVRRMEDAGDLHPVRIGPKQVRRFDPREVSARARHVPEKNPIATGNLAARERVPNSDATRQAAHAAITFSLTISPWIQVQRRLHDASRAVALRAGRRMHATRYRPDRRPS